MTPPGAPWSPGIRQRRNGKPTEPSRARRLKEGRSFPARLSTRPAMPHQRPRDILVGDPLVPVEVRIAALRRSGDRRHSVERRKSDRAPCRGAQQGSEIAPVSRAMRGCCAPARIRAVRRCTQSRFRLRASGTSPPQTPRLAGTCPWPPTAFRKAHRNQPPPIPSQQRRDPAPMRSPVSRPPFEHWTDIRERLG